MDLLELPGLERILCAKLLCVWLQHDLGMRKHIDYVLHICNQRTYLLKQLKRQGLPSAQLQRVFDAIILSRVLYAASSWRGYLSAADTECLQQLFVKAKRWNIVSNFYDIDAIFDNCNQTLFRSSLNNNNNNDNLYSAVT